MFFKLFPIQLFSSNPVLPFFSIWFFFYYFLFYSCPLPSSSLSLPWPLFFLVSSAERSISSILFFSSLFLSAVPSPYFMLSFFLSFPLLLCSFILFFLHYLLFSFFPSANCSLLSISFICSFFILWFPLSLFLCFPFFHSHLLPSSVPFFPFTVLCSPLFFTSS